MLIAGMLAEDYSAGQITGWHGKHANELCYLKAVWGSLEFIPNYFTVSNELFVFFNSITSHLYLRHRVIASPVSVNNFHAGTTPIPRLCAR